MHKYTDTAIVGARGYAGLELARLLLKHPHARLEAAYSTDSAFALSDYLPENEARSVECRVVSELFIQLKKYKTVFLATPPEVSVELAPKLLEMGAQVIDLSGAFRLEGAVYGLQPFAESKDFKNTQFVSNPGCYATSVLMALIPLLKAGILDTSSIVIDAKSGTSGGGRKAAENLLFNEVDGECLPYRVGKHQHLPEIELFAKAFSGKAISPHFTTHLLPTRRGIISGIYARLSPGRQLADVDRAFQQAYENYPLARYGSGNSHGTSLSLKKVVGSARTHISYEVVGDKLYLFSLIDNLLKGAASQAIENFNSLHEFPLETGLQHCEGCL